MVPKPIPLSLPHPSQPTSCEHCYQRRRLTRWVGPGQKLSVCAECEEALNEACGAFVDAIDTAVAA